MTTPYARAGNSDLREKIDEAKRLLPMPKVLEKFGLGAHAKKSAHCPFHEDEHNSFSVFHGNDGKGWQWKCHSGCGYGDEIALLVKVKGINRREAITLYLEMAGFPPAAPRSRECPKSHEYPDCPECPVFPVCPVSNGQTVAMHRVAAELQTELKTLAGRNACTGNTRPEDSSWQLARDLKAVRKRIGRRLHVTELMIAFYEWHRLSEPLLDAEKTRDQYWMDFLA